MPEETASIVLFDILISVYLIVDFLCNDFLCKSRRLLASVWEFSQLPVHCLMFTNQEGFVLSRFSFPLPFTCPFDGHLNLLYSFTGV